MKHIFAIGTFCVLTFGSAMLSAQDAPEISQRNPDEPPPGEEKTGVVIISPGEGQAFTVDEEGRVYQRRGYRGVVPGLRDETEIPVKKQAAAPSMEQKAAVVNWVGFQPFDAYSRVFVQVAGEFEFSVTRPDRTLIEISLPNTGISTRNDLRELVTRWFPTNVDRVEVRQNPPSGALDLGSVTVTIHLKKPAGYLYRRDGGYVFVDVEM